MRITLTLVVSICLFGFNVEPCRKIQIVPFTSYSGRVDPFKLASLVEERFKSLGFEVYNTTSNSQDDCKRFSCVIWHSEHYWQNKRDTVALSIYNSDNELVAKYFGVSRPIELTFKSGYTKATKSALAKIGSTKDW
jgi:hypothetical protein